MILMQLFELKKFHLSSYYVAPCIYLIHTILNNEQQTNKSERSHLATQGLEDPKKGDITKITPYYNRQASYGLLCPLSCSVDELIMNNS